MFRHGWRHLGVTRVGISMAAERAAFGCTVAMSTLVGNGGWSVEFNLSVETLAAGGVWERSWMGLGWVNAEGDLCFEMRDLEYRHRRA